MLTPGRHDIPSHKSTIRMRSLTQLAVRWAWCRWGVVVCLLAEVAGNAPPISWPTSQRHRHQLLLLLTASVTNRHVPSTLTRTGHYCISTLRSGSIVLSFLYGPHFWRGTENAGMENAELHGKRGTKSHGWKTQDRKTGDQISQGWKNQDHQLWNAKWISLNVGL